MLASFGSRAQGEFRIPKIDFKDSVASDFPIYDQLKIKDKKALVVKFFDYGFNRELVNKYIVFMNNGGGYTLYSKTCFKAGEFSH